MFETLCVASKGVLAIIAETIGTLQNAATAGLAAANVNGTLCALTYGWGIHFTASPMKMRDIGMSPSLRSLLRLVQFQVPEEQMILQALLISFGYMNPPRLSRLLAAFLRKARLLFLELDSIFSLRLLKKVLYNIQRYPQSSKTEMDEEKVLISTYYEEIRSHLDENNSTKLAPLMTAVTSIVLPINAEIDGNNLNVFKHKSFQFNMDKSYLTSSNFIAERVQSMHDIIVSGNNLLVYGGAGIGKTVCIDVLAQTMSQTEKVKVASQLIEGVRSTAIGVVEERTSVSSTKTPNDTGKMVIFSDSESDEDSDSDSSVDSDRSVSKGYVQRGPVDMHFINPVALTFDNLFGTFTSGAKGLAAGALTTIESRLISNSSGFGVCGRSLLNSENGLF